MRKVYKCVLPFVVTQIVKQLVIWWTDAGDLVTKIHMSASCDISCHQCFVDAFHLFLQAIMCIHMLELF